MTTLRSTPPTHHVGLLIRKHHMRREMSTLDNIGSRSAFSENRNLIVEPNNASERICPPHSCPSWGACEEATGIGVVRVEPSTLRELLEPHQSCHALAETET